MASEKRVAFSTGFILSADAFQAMVREIHGSMLLNGRTRHTHFVGHLADGRLVEFEDATHVINHDISGLSEITELHVISTSGEASFRNRSLFGIPSPSLTPSSRAEDYIHVRFSRPKRLTYQEDSELLVSSENDDFSFAVGQRVEDRLREATCSSVIKLIHQSNFALYASSIMLILALICLQIFFPSPSAYSASSLRSMYEAGRFKDAIDFMIFLREQNSSATRGFILLLLLAAGASVGGFVSTLLVRFLRYLYPINIFAWGGGLRAYNKAIAGRKHTFNVVFVAVILTSAVGIATDLLSARFFSW